MVGSEDARVAVDWRDQSRKLKPADDSADAIESSIDLTRRMIAEADEALVAFGGIMAEMIFADASREEIDAVKASRAAASDFLGEAVVILAHLEAKLPAARKRALLDGFAAAREVLESADADAVRAWQSEYRAAAECIRSLLDGLRAARTKAHEYRRQAQDVIRAGLLSADDLPEPALASRDLFCFDCVEDMVQLPSPDGLLRDEAIWQPLKLLRDTQRQQRADMVRAEDLALARVAQRQDVQARIHAGDVVEAMSAGKKRGA